MATKPTAAQVTTNQNDVDAALIALADYYESIAWGQSAYESDALDHGFN